MRRMIWLFGLTCWATLYAQQVAFERGFYSFEAIAKALSVGGRQVLCEPTLKQRMALLSLKARDWEAMRQLLQMRRFLQSRLPLREAILRTIEQGEFIQVEVLPPTISTLLPEEKGEVREDAVSSCLGSVLPYTCILSICRSRSRGREE